jgi:hypothetical protein
MGLVFRVESPAETDVYKGEAFRPEAEGIGRVLDVRKIPYHSSHEDIDGHRRSRIHWVELCSTRDGAG